MMYDYHVMTTDKDRLIDLKQKLQEYRAQADAWRREREKADRKVRVFEALCDYCQRLMKAEELVAGGVDLEIEHLEVSAELGESVLSISVPKAVSNVLHSNQRPMRSSEIYERVEELYPNIVVGDLKRQVSNALGRGVRMGQYERVAQGVYRVISKG